MRLPSTTPFPYTTLFRSVDNVRLTESVVPNASFESPVTDFASPFMDAWEKSPQPFWYNDPVFPWFALMGEFVNIGNADVCHIVTLRGRMAAYLLAVHEVA